jgi:hypothetical protein
MGKKARKMRGLVKRVVTLLKKWVNHPSATFVWLLGISILNFGILIPVHGFYWDDLPYLYQYSAFGPAGFPAYVASDRPFSAWIFAATTALFGYQPLGYHILALLLRWACASLFFLILRNLWPSKNTENVIAASIFAIYPGFLQQPIALIYNHHFSVFAMFLASLYLMIINLKKERPSLLISIISVALNFSMFSIENFAMLELIRPFIIFKINKERNPSQKSPILKSLLQWTPYLAVLAAFIIWRVFIFKFPTYKPAGVQGILAAPLETIGGILLRIPHDFYIVVINAWALTLYLPTVADFGRSATYLFWVIVTATAAVTIFFFACMGPDYENKPNPQGSDNSRLEQFLAAILLFLLAGSILWGLDLPVGNRFAWDRMTLAFFPAVGLFGASLFSLLKGKKWIMIVLLTALFSLTSSHNYQNGIAFKREWDNLQDFLTQLSWRIPSLSENTIFITSNPGLNYYSDNSLTSPINLQYANTLAQQELSHFVYYTDARTEDWFENDLFGQDYKKRYRSFIFHGNTGNAITYRFEPPSCVQILDRKFANSITTPNMTDREVKETRFTNLDLIQQSPSRPPFEPLFTASDNGSWCYYFESADLARQFNDFAQVVRLGNEAIANGKAPRTVSEWLPFLEGYVWQGDFGTAQMIIDQITQAEGNFTTGMCYTLQRIIRDDTFPHPDELTRLITYNQCQP